MRDYHSTTRYKGLNNDRAPTQTLCNFVSCLTLFPLARYRPLRTAFNPFHRFTPPPSNTSRTSIPWHPSFSSGLQFWNNLSSSSLLCNSQQKHYCFYRPKAWHQACMRNSPQPLHVRFSFPFSTHFHVPKCLATGQRRSGTRIRKGETNITYRGNKLLCQEMRDACRESSESLDSPRRYSYVQVLSFSVRPGLHAWYSFEHLVPSSE